MTSDDNDGNEELFTSPRTPTEEEIADAQRDSPGYYDQLNSAASEAVEDGTERDSDD
jgi:hypothetical protein